MCRNRTHNALHVNLWGRGQKPSNDIRICRKLSSMPRAIVPLITGSIGEDLLRRFIKKCAASIQPWLSFALT